MPTYDPYTGKPYPADKPAPVDESVTPSRSEGGSPGRAGAGARPNLEPSTLPAPNLDATSGPSGSNPAAKTPREQGRTHGGNVNAEAATATPAQPTPWEDLANQLVASYGSTIAALTPQASGQTAATADASMSKNAEAMLGQGSTSPMAQWLNSHPAAAQAQSSALTTAEQAQETAAQEGSAQIQGGLKALGVAEQQQMNAAPYAQLLTALAADVPYKLLGGETLPQVRSDINTAVADIGLNPKSSTTSTIGGLPAPNVAAGSPNPFSTTLNTSTTNPAPQG